MAGRKLSSIVPARQRAPWEIVRRVLPKPGAWMETFKQVAGFTLLATSLWLLHSVDDKWLFPTLITMLGLGLGCWLFNRERLIGVLTATAIGSRLRRHAAGS